MWNTKYTKNTSRLSPKDRRNWQDAATKKLAEKASSGQAEKYANHVTKAAMQRRLNKSEKKKTKGNPLNG